MKKKHIWVFYQDGGTPTQSWGDRHYFLANHYCPEKYVVTIFAANDSHMFSKRVEFQGNFWVTKYNLLNYCWVKVNAYNRGRSKRRVLSWVIFAMKLFFIPRKRIEKPDIIIVSSMPIFPVITALFYKMIWGAKVIFEIRDIWPLTIIEMEGYSRFNPFIALLRGIEKIAYKKSDYLVSVLDKADQHIRKSIKKSFNFSWISNGIDYELIENNSFDENSKALESIPKGKFIVGYAGKMSISNALEFIIEAARLLASDNNIHFVFLGDGDQKRNLIAQARGLSNITFLPKIGKYQVHPLLRSFDVAIISFRKLDLYKYGISTNKLFDYMMADLPIIMASNYRHDAYSKAGSIFIAEPENPIEIKSKILEISKIPKEQLVSLGRKGRIFVYENFLYQKLAMKYEEIFETLSQRP